MKILYIFLVSILCSCASPGFKVVKPTRIESYGGYVQPDSLANELENGSKKKKWNR